MSNAEKQPTGHGPEGCDENGPAPVPRPRDRLRINLDMRPPRVRQLPDRRPILIATKAMLFVGQDTSVWPSPELAQPGEASPVQEYRLRLKQLPSASCRPARHLPFQSSTRLVPRGSCPSRPFFRGALLALRFRLEKYAQHTFSTETERRKNSGSSQSLASLLRLTTTN